MTPSLGRPATGRPDRDRPLLAAARVAAARGWPVFPVAPYSKHPAISDWEHQASCDPDVLAAWWNAAPYNIGIACGPASLVVVDLDDGHGQPPPGQWAGQQVTSGRDVFAILAQRHHDAIADTYTVATPTGGEHRYYLAPPDHALRNTVAALGWRIDTRAAGGFVIAAGSTRRVEGRTRRYTVTDPAPVAVLPDWITTALTAPPRSERAENPHVPLSVTRLDAWVTAAVDGETRAVRGAIPGQRNMILFTAACRLGELVGAGVLDARDAAAALRHAASVHFGIDGFTPLEADRTIANGLGRGGEHPRVITLDGDA